MSELWQVETGDYEQRYTMFVADSPELAEKRLHATYLAPYKVRWEPMKDTTWEEGDVTYRTFEVVGHFEGVQGYSTQHTAEYDISQIEYVTLRGEE